jgi:RHS repeat-associated protein
MAGISSKAAGKLENKFKYNGIEHNTDFDLNMYDAFYRNLDPQIGRFWQIDPEAESLEDYSPFASMYNNPISIVDPLGDFGSRFGAWLHKVFNGGGTIGENKYGEFYVQKNSATEDGSVIVSLTYGKGRDMYSNAREALARDAEIEADIQMNGENSMYQMYNSPREAGFAALTYSGLFLIKPIFSKGGNTKPQLLLESQRMRMLRTAQNPKLKDLIDKLWRPGAKYGDGSTGAMIKLEQSQGVATSPTGSHIQKATEALDTSKKLLKGNFGTLSETDRGLVFEIIENLTNGTGLKY